MEINLAQLLLICFIALVVLGPKRLLPLARQLGFWFSRVKRLNQSWQQWFNRELGIDALRKDLHLQQNRLERQFLQAEQRMRRWQENLSPSAHQVENAPNYDFLEAKAQTSIAKTETVFSFPTIHIDYSALHRKTIKLEQSTRFED